MRAHLNISLAREGRGVGGKSLRGVFALKTIQNCCKMEESANGRGWYSGPSVFAYLSFPFVYQ